MTGLFDHYLVAMFLEIVTDMSFGPKLSHNLVDQNIWSLFGCKIAIKIFSRKLHSQFMIFFFCGDKRKPRSKAEQINRTN